MIILCLLSLLYIVVNQYAQYVAGYKKGFEDAKSAENK